MSDKYVYIIERFSKDIYQKRRVFSETACYVTLYDVDWRTGEETGRAGRKQRKDSDIHESFDSMKLELRKRAELAVEQAERQLASAYKRRELVVDLEER